LSASNPQIISASESFSTDTASLTYAGSGTFTLSTLANAPVGTFLTYTYAINSNTLTQTNAAAPSQSTSDMNTNGIRIFTRAYNAASTSGNPARVAIQIGKNFKGHSVYGFTTTGKTVGVQTDYSVVSSTICLGMAVQDYNPSTGVLILDAGFQQLSSNSTAAFSGADNSFPTDAYFTISASKSPALVGVPQVEPRFATLSHVLSNGTSFGGAAAATQNTRPLNTLVDSGNLGVTLASNQFTLPAGSYYIEGYSVAHRVGFNKVRLRNITSSSTAIIGTSVNSNTTTGDITTSLLSGQVTLTSSTVFEVQHYTTSANATNGLGNAVSSGESEVYCNIKITKVR
jgi:hypothetical protein